MIFVLSLRVLLSLDEISVMLLNPVWTDFQRATDSWKPGFAACEVGPFSTCHDEKALGEAASWKKPSHVVVRFPKQCITFRPGGLHVHCFVGSLHGVPCPLLTLTALPGVPHGHHLPHIMFSLVLLIQELARTTGRAQQHPEAMLRAGRKVGDLWVKQDGDHNNMVQYHAHGGPELYPVLSWALMQLDAKWS